MHKTEYDRTEDNTLALNSNENSYRGMMNEDNSTPEKDGELTSNIDTENIRIEFAVKSNVQYNSNKKSSKSQSAKGSSKKTSPQKSPNRASPNKRSNFNSPSKPEKTDFSNTSLKNLHSNQKLETAEFNRDIQVHSPQATTPFNHTPQKQKATASVSNNMEESDDQSISVSLVPKTPMTAITAPVNAA